ncbi:hypothetical protein ACIA8F_19505 [Streptomyces sp. NPDC051563]|uniref:hypothetical protein n=1 Tax=Streptomyces sp. NPDC051563 TaxID=3365659 RepID=UPI00378852DB
MATGFACREFSFDAGKRGVKLKVIGFEMSADSPMIGTVSMAQGDVDDTPPSLLEVLSGAPAKFCYTLFLNYNLTVEKPPGGGPAVVLSNAQTATLICNLLTCVPAPRLGIPAPEAPRPRSGGDTQPGCCPTAPVPRDLQRQLIAAAHKETSVQQR